MAGFGDGFLDRFAESAIPGGIIEHIEIGSGGKKGFRGLLLFYLSFLLSFFNDDPFRVTCQGVEPELERPCPTRRRRRARAPRSHLSDGNAPGEAPRRGNEEKRGEDGAEGICGNCCFQEEERAGHRRR